MAEPAVVVIEDEAEIKRFLRVTLHAQGYRLFEAANGADGLVEVATRQPDVVVVDPTVGCNTDFDVVDTAIAVGAKVIVFSRSAEAPASGRYVPEPLFVAKPDLWALEQRVVQQLEGSPIIASIAAASSLPLERGVNTAMS